MAVINGTDAPETLFGTEEDDTINGGGAPSANNLNPDDTIYGLGGNDTIEGGHGNDTVYAGEGADYLTAAVGGSDALYGDAGNDHIVMSERGTPPPIADGGEGNDWIEVTAAQVDIRGGGGNDIIFYRGGTFMLVPSTIDAGAGDDWIIFEGGGNRATPITLGEGTDLVEVRAADIKISDFMVGDGGDQLDLRALGPDPFGSGRFALVQSGADTWIQEVATGAIYVQLLNVQASSLTAYNLEGDSSNIPRDLTGTNGPDELYGGSNQDVLRGLGGNDRLDGKGDADLMIGGPGDDFYFVDDPGDRIEEASGEGFDNVLASVSYILTSGAEVEILSTTNHGGTDAINLTGNELRQVVIGNAAANTLTGGGGADALQGLGGNDFLFVDADDAILEDVGGGYDNVLASATFTLNAGAAAEVLSTTNHSGTAAINLTGNELGQVVIGNAAANTLTGGGGVDALQGLGGDDFLYVDADDVVLEVAGGGYDNVLASTSYVLNAGAAVEILSTTNHGGTGAINLTGNAFNQAVIGNTAANILDGAGGADALVGLGGADTFAFTTALGGGNVDAILDFSTIDDTIALDDAIFTALTPGPLPTGAFVVGTAAADAGDRIVYDGATGNIFYDADGSGAGAAVLFATVTAGTALTAADFTVI